MITTILFIFHYKDEKKTDLSLLSSEVRDKICTQFIAF